MFPAFPRPLPYPLDRASNLEVVVGDDLEVCGLPEFPEDSDEKITVLFRLSLNEFVALATAVDVGSDIAYGDNGINVWYLWAVSVMCAQFCEEVAQCFIEQNEALMTAVAAALQSNPQLLAAISSAMSELGTGIPGQPLTTNQAGQDFLPGNVKPDDECDNDALWGACLYLVQSGNRAITDVFEQIEAASNTLETSAIVAETIPAAGSYASAAVEFADQLQENLTEGYASAYTEEYEEQLACAIFCAARDADCTLSIDMLIDIMNNRLPDPEDIINFGLVMARIGTGTFSGQEIADASFLIYFTAMKFGQQFGDIIGFRPLTDLMSLGADQLASDNWETLCDCPVTWESDMDLTGTEDYGFVPDSYPGGGTAGHFVSGVGIVGDYGVVGGAAYRMVQGGWVFDASEVTYVEQFYDIENGSNGGITRVVAAGATTLNSTGDIPPDGVGSFSGSGDVSGATTASLRAQSGFFAGSTADPGGTVVVTRVIIRGNGVKPPQLP